MAKQRQRITSAQIEKAKETKLKIPRVDDEELKSDRITFVGHFMHQRFGDNPFSIPIRCHTLLANTCDSIKRRIKVSARDTRISNLWVDDVSRTGYVLIENRAGAGMLVRPTRKELKTLEKQVVKVRFEGAKKGSIIRPGMWFIAEPEDLSELILRAENEPVDVNIYIVSN